MGKIKILFVCLGNICRSAAAEAVMKKFAANAGLSDNVYIDSAGILSVHAGEQADPRMRLIAGRRGYDVTSISRPVRPSDFDDFDIIIGMDDTNIDDLNCKAVTSEHLDKIHKMTEFQKTGTESYVPDPYYGGESGFERVIDILEDSCSGLLEYITK